MSSNLRDKLFKYWRKAFFALGALCSILTIFLPLTVMEKIVGVIGVMLLLSFMANFILHSRLNTVEESLEDQKGYDNLIDEKYTLPVFIHNKSLEVRVSEGNDRVKYKYTISSTDGNTIENFYALIGTDKEVSWEDLDISTEGGQIEEYHRRDYEEFSRFIITFRLFDAVGPNDTYEISYSLEHDVVDIDDDYSYLNIRHDTETTNFELIFPDGYQPVRYVASQKETGMDEESTETDRSLPDPELNQNEGQACITWSCSSVSLGNRYKLDWIVEEDSSW